jgi:mono/diheme cytochrome c family protein
VPRPGFDKAGSRKISRHRTAFFVVLLLPDLGTQPAPQRTYMKATLIVVLPLVVVFGAGCSDASGELSPDPALGGATAAGTGGQLASAGTAGTASAGVSAGGAAGSVGAGGVQSGGASTSGGAGVAGGGGSVPLDGRGLYDANCKACHGEQGAGSVLAPETMHPVRDYSTWVVRNGRAQTTFAKPMDKWGADKLSDAQLMLIFDYLDQPPQPTTGKALYDDYCANCHGADGKGGPTTRNIINEVGKVLMQVRSGKNVGKFDPRRDYMPAFPTSDISDAELTLIHDYVDSL